MPQKEDTLIIEAYISNQDATSDDKEQQRIILDGFKDHRPMLLLEKWKVYVTQNKYVIPIDFRLMLSIYCPAHNKKIFALFDRQG